MTANASYEVQEKLEEFYTGGQVQVKQCAGRGIEMCTNTLIYMLVSVPAYLHVASAVRKW